jgi:hypothetical protein
VVGVLRVFLIGAQRIDEDLSWQKRNSSVASRT